MEIDTTGMLEDLIDIQAENDRYLDLLQRWIEAESYWEFGETVEPVHTETVQALKAAGRDWKDWRLGDGK